MSQTLSLPAPSSANPGALVEDRQKIPHIHLRAQLGSIHRQYKPLETYDAVSGVDDAGGVASSFVQQVVAHLEEEEEEELKALLKDTYAMDEDSLEQHVLDLMHKHRDDVAGVPFLFLTPTRRPISRPSSRASSHSLRLRPDTPISAPSSPLNLAFRRPHTPATSPLAPATIQPSSYVTARSASPHSSPILLHSQMSHPNPQLTMSLPSSPMSSPRLLNAKASEFKPIQRPLSAASSNPASLSALRSDTPSPDLWALKASSNLAIAAPLIPEQSYAPRPIAASSLRSSLRPDEDEDEDDPFDPFTSKSITTSLHSFTVTDFDSHWSNSSNSSRSPEDVRLLDQASFPDSEFDNPLEDPPELDSEAAMLTDGMTPFDVLSSVFGSTLAPSELEDALAANGYDFERAMAWLVDRALPPVPPAPYVRTQNLGGRITLVSRDIGSMRGGRPGSENMSAPGRTSRYANGRPIQSGNRVCRYFIAGECLRADCRFSHDLERALCRFWLRGTCAKQESCEFLHHLPKNVDISSLTTDVSHAAVSPVSASPPQDDFPTLDTAVAGRGQRGSYGNDHSHHDPGRTRFAAAVKKPAALSPVLSAATYGNDQTLAARREAMGNSAESLHHRSAIVAPRPSPRIKLRPPSLLPTLPTGESINKLYMNYRSRALQLGAARNACLSRAADAWRRGDGAAAKRFSREGHDLNGKMGLEMAEAAGNVVRERARLSEQAVRTRDSSWSDDPGDRTSRGRMCGNGLGVCLGIARRDVGGDISSTPEERTEAMLDLHGLHSNEAAEVLEEFSLALEREHFYGLAYIVVGEEKHTGKFAGSTRLATGVREWLHRWGYPWSERDGVICVDPMTHA